MPHEWKRVRRSTASPDSRRTWLRSQRDARPLSLSSLILIVARPHTWRCADARPDLCARRTNAPQPLRGARSIAADCTLAPPKQWCAQVTSIYSGRSAPPRNTCESFTDERMFFDSFGANGQEGVGECWVPTIAASAQAESERYGFRTVLRFANPERAWRLAEVDSNTALTFYCDFSIELCLFSKTI